MLNVFSIFLLLTSILSFLLGFLVLFKRSKKNTMTLAFLGLTFFTSLWALSYYLSISINNYDIAIFWAKMVTFNSIWIPIFLFNWVRLFLKDIGLRKVHFNDYVMYVSYFLGFFFSFFSFSKLMISSFEQKLFFSVWPNPGILYHFYFIFCYVELSFYTGIILLKYYKIARGYARNQIKYVSIGCIVALMGGISNFFLWYNILIPPYGIFFIPIYPVAFTYAMIKYRLMDIRLVISKSILYVILVSVVTFTFTVFTFLAGRIFAETSDFSGLLVTFIVSLVVVIGLDPLKRFLSKITDNIFYKGKIDYQEVLRKLSEIIAIEIDLNKLLINLSNTLSKLIKCENVDFLHLQDIAGIYRGVSDKNILITKNDNIFNYINDKREIIITEELERLSFESNNTYDLVGIVDRLKKMQIGLIAPVLAEGKITAFLIITKKLSGDIFSAQDVNLISVLTPQIANALEKAKLYGEIQKFNINLQDKVDQATKELKQVNIDLASRNKYLVALQKISSTITRTLDLSAVIEFIASSVRNELGFIGGVVNFVDEDGKYIYIGGMSADESVRNAVSVLKKDPREYKIFLKEKNNIAIKSIVTGEIQKSDKVYDFFVPAISELDANKIQESLKIKSGISVPIYSENRIIGSIDFFLEKTIDRIKKEDLDVMKALADQTGLVIRNLNLYRELSSKNMELKDANIHLKKLDQAKSEFLSIASHQLRTPLTGIKGYLSMIIEGDYGKVPDRLLKIIKEVFEAGDRMSRLVNVFLNVSRIESGRLKLDFSEVDIASVIDRCIKDLESNAKKKNIVLNFKDSRSDDKKDKKINADPDKLKDTILNLIDNAIKYTEKGSVVVELSNDKNNVIVKIKDTGIGLSDSEIDRLFSKFSRGDDSAKINTDGSGLGLYIARKIVEAHDGKIWVESEGKGKGSTFQFTLSFNKVNIEKE
ncbi:MAG: ATP-binding protein [Patescibacteria group bacterium]|nr:ATP-binding protein [Patescibacteria group bacterium]MDD4695622.1 ATP-binding protein [Patescibacteria group bacterium]